MAVTIHLPPVSFITIKAYSRLSGAFLKACCQAVNFRAALQGFFSDKVQYFLEPDFTQVKEKGKSRFSFLAKSWNSSVVTWECFCTPKGQCVPKMS